MIGFASLRVVPVACGFLRSTWWFGGVCWFGFVLWDLFVIGCFWWFVLGCGCGSINSVVIHV